MATAPSSLHGHLSTFFPLAPPLRRFHARLSVAPRAASDDGGDTPPSEDESQPGTEAGDEFESRLSQVRLKYRSGQGKKAEIRKVRKKGTSGGGGGAAGGGGGGGGGGGIFLPPVPLKEAVAAGMKVELGFSPYSERINGRIAMLGLTALLLVELATGKGVINYHSPAIILIQIYFVAAVGALFVKYEKEKVSIWPQPSASSSSSDK